MQQRESKHNALCCGNWSNASNAGVFNRNFNNNRSNDNNNCSFRSVDYDSKPDIIRTGDIGVTFPASLAKSAKEATAIQDLFPYNLEHICCVDNLYNGYLLARKHKRNKKAIYDFEKDLGTNLEKLSDEIKNLSYKPEKYRTFKVYEPKERLIVAPAFRDCVVQHTIYDYVYELFDKSFIFDSYGCRKGKGTHSASQRLQDFMRKHSSESFYLQLDIKKYYYSIDHKILRKRIERKIDDIMLVNLIMLFVDTEKGKGLLVGNVLSQLFGLVYLDYLDHFIKRDLKAKHYLRYVDDFILIGQKNRDESYALKIKIQEFLEDKLNLNLSKYTISQIKKGSNFVGYRTWKSRKFIRKRSLHNFSKAVRENKTESLHSMLGHAKNTSSLTHLKNKIKEQHALQV